MSDFSTESEHKPLTHEMFMKPDGEQKPDARAGTLPGLQLPSLLGGTGTSVNPLLAQSLFGHYTDTPQSVLQTPGPTVGPLASLVEPKPTLADYRDHGDKDIDGQIGYNRELRGLIDKGGPIKPEITKAETDRLNEGREDLLGDLKERSGVYDAEIAAISGKKMQYEYVDKNREGDHICYISDLRKMYAHFPEWRLTKSLDDIFQEIYASWQTRAAG